MNNPRGFKGGEVEPTIFGMNFRSFKKIKMFIFIATSGWTIYTFVFTRFNRKRYRVLDSEGEPVELSPRLKELAELTLKQIVYPLSYRKKTEFFLTDQIDFVNLSAPWFNTLITGNSRIGIPFYYEIFDSNDVTEEFLEKVSQKLPLKEDKKEAWYQTEEGKMLIESLKLKNEAKMYGIAQNIHIQATNHPLFSKALLPCLILLALKLHDFTHSQVGTILGPQGQVIYVITIAIITLSFVYISQALSLSDAIRNSDHDIFSSRYTDFKTAAIEYYEKWIQRNKALRVLIRRGNRAYSVRGDPQAWSKAVSESLEVRLNWTKRNLEKLDGSKLGNPVEEI
ncbi:uncharacterized protein LOC141851044 [Brevipalpus obovatus]|uniref:uncharacterized protein LOC141851044 n=1 Tax=Brevipalpus obovatus TaxID=246614 RepID=UPI003D9DF3DF